MTLIVLYEECREFLVKLGLKPRQLAYKREAIDETTPGAKDYQDAVKWLRAFIDLRISAYNHVRGLVSEERWQFYENVAPDAGTYEQQELEKVRIALLNDWKSRPNLLRKVKHERFDQVGPRKRIKKKAK